MKDIIELFKEKALRFANNEIGDQPLYAEINGGESAEKPYCYSFSVQYKRNRDDTNCSIKRFVVKKRGQTYYAYLASAMNHYPSRTNCIRWDRYIFIQEENKLKSF